LKLKKIVTCPSWNLLVRIFGRFTSRIEQELGTPTTSLACAKILTSSGGNRNYFRQKKQNVYYIAPYCTSFQNAWKILTGLILPLPTSHLGPQSLE
jgi:hypothetical protein